MHDFNTKGKKCALAFGEPCPGEFLMDNDAGCPHWKQLVIERSDGGMAEVWTGCGILMQDHLTVGVASSVNCATDTVANLRDEIISCFDNGLSKVSLAIEKANPRLLNGGE